MCSKFGNLSLFRQLPSLSYLPVFTLSHSVILSLLFLSPGFHPHCCSAWLASTCLPGKDFAHFLLQPEQKLKDTMSKWSSVAPSSSRRHQQVLVSFCCSLRTPRSLLGWLFLCHPFPWICVPPASELSKGVSPCSWASARASLGTCWFCRRFKNACLHFLVFQLSPL